MKDDARTILEQIGDPADVDRELRKFRQSARSLSSRYGQLAGKYAGQWVAAFDGKVRARGQSFQEVIEKIDQEGLPKEHTIVRFIDNDDRTMIL
jgi:hypothetical protein